MKNMRKHARTILLSVISATLIACSHSSEAVIQTRNNNRGRESAQRVVISNTSTIEMENEFDYLCGLYCCEEKLIIAGMNGGVPTMSLYDTEGNRKSQHTLYKSNADAGYLYRIGKSIDDGFAAYFGNDPYDYENMQYTLTSYDMNGEPQQETKIDELFGMHFGPIETRFGWILWLPYEVTVIDQSGASVTFPVPDDLELFSMCVDNHGKTYAVVEKDYTVGICEFSPQTGDYGDFVKCSDGKGCYSHVNDPNGEIYVNDGLRLWKYDSQKDDFHECVKWEGSNINGEEIECIVPLGDGSFALTTYADNTVFLVTNETREIERKIITIGVIEGGNSQIERLVSTFNNSNQEYYAEIRYYADETNLVTELTSGSAPDVLEMSIVDIPLTDSNVVDLNAYLSETEQRITGNIVDSVSMNGKVYVLPDSVSFTTLIGRSSDVGNKPGWSMDEFQRILDGKGMDVSAFPAWMTRDELLLWICYISIGQFVDEDSYTCDFKSDEFINLLEFCNALPETFEPSGIISDYDENVLLTIEMIENPDRLDAINMNYGIYDYTYIGFPNENSETGSFYSLPDGGILLSIPVGSGNKDGAWEFISTMLSPKWQRKVNAIPANADVFSDQYITLAEKDYYTLEQGDVDKFIDVLNRVDSFIFFHSVPRDIIMEEAQAYFSGDKTVQDAVDIIQSRVSLYLSEQQ